MAKYTYDQLKTNENERKKLLDTLKTLREQAGLWKPAALADEEKKAPQEEMAQSLRDKIGQVEELLGNPAPKGEEKKQRAAFDKALEELGGSMKAVRHDPELGELFNKAREQAPELDDVAAGIGLARDNTVDYIAEHYRTIANQDNASLTFDQKMSCIAGFLALHELVGDEKAPGEKEVDLKTFEKQHAEPMAERLAQFSKLHFGDKDSLPYDANYLDKEKFGEIGRPLALRFVIPPAADAFGENEYPNAPPIGRAFLFARAPARSGSLCGYSVRGGSSACSRKVYLVLTN